jgi:hypothetical protein
MDLAVELAIQVGELVSGKQVKKALPRSILH